MTPASATTPTSAMTYTYAGGLYRIYERGQYLGALHSRHAADAYIAAATRSVRNAHAGNKRRAA